MKASQKSLKDWGSQDWRTKSGKKSSETGERYLPAKAIKALSRLSMQQPPRPSEKLQQRASSLPSSQRRWLRRLRGLDEKPSLCTRKEGQNPKGGLNAKGRASAKAEGMNLKAPVKSGDNPRRASFLARMGGNAGPEYKDGEPTRLLLSLKAWGASPKLMRSRKPNRISARNKAK
jgi:hypothetical protein